MAKLVTICTSADAVYVSFSHFFTAVLTHVLKRERDIEKHCTQYCNMCNKQFKMGGYYTLL
jgi:hypothetical protein